MNTSLGKRAKRTTAVAVSALALGAAGVIASDLVPSAPNAYAQNLTATVESAQVPGFADIVERVSPAVVSIRVKSEARPRLSGLEGFGDNSPFERFFRQFEDQFGVEPEQFRDRRGPRGRGFRAEGQGSGFFVSEDGYIVTNNHVVDGAAEVLVVMNDGEILEAEVIGVDDKTDLALVKVTGNDRIFPYVTFNRDEVRVGDWVVAVGNPFGLGGTVTAGIVSARGREIGAGPYDDFIQIDAPINRGNSGGPTFDLEGEVVGVNTAIYSPSGGSVGIGFAVPASIAEQVIEDLKDDGKVTRGWLGVQIQPITLEIAESIGLGTVSGALVTEPQQDSPARTAGILEGDAILAVDGQDVEGPRDLARIIAGKAPGSDVVLRVWRDGAERTVDVTLGRLKAAEQEASLGEGGGTPDARAGAPTSFGMTDAPADELGVDDDGLAVVEIEPAGVAAEKGVSVGDVILSANGEPLRSYDDLEESVEMARRDGRKNVLLKLRTGENVRFIALPIEKA
jgi:serine protease Do